MLKSFLSLCTVCLLLFGCESLFDKTDKVDLSMLEGSTCVLSVNRISTEDDASFPTDELDEEDYVASDEGDTYDVVFSDDGMTVSIEPVGYKGELTDESRKELYYNLVDGVFAGGRFVVWIEEDHFEAEMVIYGSGVPIVGGVRGRLEPVSE